MWIITKIGFFSVVEKPEDAEGGNLTIRSRVRSDLENLRDRYLPDMGEIGDSTASDYRFRAVAPRDAVSAAMAALVAGIDYSNFKSAVSVTQGYGRAEVYGHVWGELYRLQSGRFEAPADDPRMI
ncbi:hypothetical protein [Novosphingobium sp. PASSN1]|uniref:hypothetical protein n=1 Tax=Novosphingobium sp. PASSN1 TaxID=2015561 RepID=UPI0025CDA4A5|nr:hypothetical protein [Novosphingobium sp. PASSN1]